MLDIILKYADDILKGFMDNASAMIRSEVDYVTGSIKENIEAGIKNGFDAVRKAAFYLFIAMGATMVALVFMIWGLAKMFEAFFKQDGLGYIVFGVVLFLIGMLSFSMSRPK